jgi:hypothetical protein
MAKSTGTIHKNLIRQNLRVARQLYSELPRRQLAILRDLTHSLRLSVSRNELLWIQGRWYVSHSGLLQIAHRRNCLGIHTAIEKQLTEPSSNRWVFKATVDVSAIKSFDGYGDADPSNISPLVRGAEMRVAETRAVNRALRKAYAVGVCSIEEIGSVAEPAQSQREARKMPSQPANGNYGGPRVRDRLCQIIRQHHLDPNQVKSYARIFAESKSCAKPPVSRSKTLSRI